MSILFMTSGSNMCCCLLCDHQTFFSILLLLLLHVTERKTSACVFSCVFETKLFAFCITSLSMMMFFLCSLYALYYTGFFSHVFIRKLLFTTYQLIAIIDHYLQDRCKTELALGNNQQPIKQFSHSDWCFFFQTSFLPLF